MIHPEVFKPVDHELISRIRSLDPQSIAASGAINTGSGLADFEDGIKVAIIGVPEYRAADYGKYVECDLNRFREKFYSLKTNSGKVGIADFGDIIPGSTLQDTYHLMTNIAAELSKALVIPVFIGGGQDLTYSIYNSYAIREQVINLVSIDSRFDLGGPEDPLNPSSWLGHIVLKQPNFLFNCSNLGYQSYFVGNELINLMDKMYFDTIRLGMVRSDIAEMEPTLRAADILTVDLSAVKQADAPGTTKPSPNGFTGDEICQAFMYAGMSERVSSLGVFEYDSISDVTGQTAHLMAQMVWYFTEGVSLRRDDFPNAEHTGFLTFRVTVPERDEEITFLKNKLSGRWWMELPVEGKNKKFSRHHYLPCSLKDYQQACKDEVPERWWQAIHKMY